MQKKKGNKYDAIIKAAGRVIAKNGYANSQISKIAKEAGVADGTVYVYFNSKEEIMINLFNEFLGGFVKEIRAELEDIDDVREGLKRLVKAHLTILQANPDLAAVCLVELRQPDQNLRLATRDVLRSYFKLLEELVEDGQKSGFFNPTLNKYVARQMIYGTLDEIVTSWVLNRRNINLTDYIPQVYKMMYNALTIH